METHKKVDSIHFHKTLIIDIETVPQHYVWEKVAEGLKAHWLQKMNVLRLKDEEKAEPEQIYKERAGIYSEFGKIVCIGMGYVHQQEGRTIIRLKSLAADDEHQLLMEFANLVAQLEQQNGDLHFCGHNIREFDIPYICRRMLINGIDLPASLNISGLKPWQVNHHDTLELWRFGDYKNYTSLDLLAQILNVPSSKSDIDGSEVASVYWEEGDLKRIEQYCLRDVYTTALVYLKLKGWKADLPEAVYV